MNIKNRIRKIEQSLNFGIQEEFCSCFDAHNTAVINKVYSEPFTSSDILPDNTQISNICGRCKRTVPGRMRSFYRFLGEAYGKKEAPQL